MAIILTADNPSALMDQFRDLCNRNKIETWRVSDQGNLRFIHSDLGDKAYFNPFFRDKTLVLRIRFFPLPQNKRETYGVLHGRLIEMFTAHCWMSFSAATWTPTPAEGDEAI